jgi:hypothetical protein
MRKASSIKFLSRAGEFGRTGVDLGHTDLASAATKRIAESATTPKQAQGGVSIDPLTINALNDGR